MKMRLLFVRTIFTLSGSYLFPATSYIYDLIYIKLSVILYTWNTSDVASKRLRSLWMGLMKHNACRRRLLSERFSEEKPPGGLTMESNVVLEVMPLRSSSQPPQSLNFGKTSSTFCLNTTGSDDFMSFFFSHRSALKIVYVFFPGWNVLL